MSSVQNSFSTNFCLLTKFDSQKCLQALQLKLWRFIFQRSLSQQCAEQMVRFWSQKLLGLLVNKYDNRQLKVVFCSCASCFHTVAMAMTMASAWPIRHKYTPDGEIQWLCMKPPIRSIGQCASCRISPAAWLSQSTSIWFHFITSYWIIQFITQVF